MTRPKIINTVVILTLAALSLAIMANSMTKPLGHDEQMYCTGGVLLAQGKTIYRDFSYVAQMPYHPLLCAALFKALNTTHYLLVGRILSSLCDILVVVCIIGIYHHVFFNSFPLAGLLLGLAAAVLFIFNPLVDYAIGFAWNHDIVILCVMLSFWLFISIDFKQKSRHWLIALIGALLTLATCMRITTALVQLLFFTVLLLQPAESLKQRFKTILPFLIASAILLIWPVWTVALAPRAFFLNLFWIPTLNSEWLHQIGMVYKKSELIYHSLTTPGYFALIAIAFYLCVILALHRRRLTISNTANPSLAVLLILTFFIIAFIPPTMWKQYLAMPVPFIVISFAFPFSYLRKLTDRTGHNKHFNIACTVVAACAVVAVAFHPVVLQRIPKLFNPQNWTPIRLHKVSEDIARKSKSPKLILTLAPLYALEGGCNIYLQLSAGPYAYRIADYLNPSDCQTTHIIGPKSLGALLENSPPSAVILGVEPKFLEEPLFYEAVKPNWERQVYDNGLIVYFRR